MTVYQNEGRWDTSNVEFSNGRILDYNKKVRTERMRYIDYGLGVFDRTAFENIEPGAVCDLADIYQQLLRADELAAFEVRERFYEAGSFSGIDELGAFLARGKENQGPRL
jgi:hypothetical protein